MKVFAQPEETFAVVIRQVRLGSRNHLQSRLEITDTLERVVPSCLELGRYKTVFGVDGVVLPTRPLCFVVPLLQRQLKSLPFLIVFSSDLLSCLYARLDACWLNCLEDVVRDNAVETYATDGDALRRAVVDLATATVVARHAPAPSSVRHVEHPAAPCAAQQTGEQRRAPLRRTAITSTSHTRIRLEDLLIPNVLVPADVTRVVIQDQDLPVLQGHLSLIGFSCLPIFDHCGRRTTTVRERSGVEWILQDLQDSPVHGKTPEDLLAGSRRSRPRQWHLFLLVPEQHLASASQLAELAKHPANRVLDLAVGYQLDLVSSGTNEADRNLPNDVSA